MITSVGGVLWRGHTGAKQSQTHVPLNVYMCFGSKNDEGVILLFSLSFNSGLLGRGTDISLHERFCYLMSTSFQLKT